ncbi:hypothetical protein ElyMa_001312400 [Elysia marginata]|uniref:PH domain-containing protein n=1 Tax=Elysia marginata TaxID=1093978 RepID=A0AAV4INB8_9GAST|nr:hypothetical protein ElyMa_001312400 [Elysia marginata]
MTFLVKCPKSRQSFLDEVEPQRLKTSRLTVWKKRLSQVYGNVMMGLTASERVPPGADTPWPERKCLKALYGQKANLKKWFYLDNGCLLVVLHADVTKRV